MYCISSTCTIFFPKFGEKLVKFNFTEFFASTHTVSFCQITTKFLNDTITTSKIFSLVSQSNNNKYVCIVTTKNIFFLRKSFFLYNILNSSPFGIFNAKYLNLVLLIHLFQENKSQNSVRSQSKIIWSKTFP